MSAGTRIYSFRLPTELMQLVAETIGRRNDWSREEPWTVSEFLRIALQEKCKKMERCRRPGRRRRRGEASEAPAKDQ